MGQASILMYSAMLGSHGHPFLPLPEITSFSWLLEHLEHTWHLLPPPPLSPHPLRVCVSVCLCDMRQVSPELRSFLPIVFTSLVLGLQVHIPRASLICGLNSLVTLPPPAPSPAPQVTSEELALWEALAERKAAY